MGLVEGINSSYGVGLSGATVMTQSGAIGITGTGGNGSGLNNKGIQMDGNSIVSPNGVGEQGWGR